MSRSWPDIAAETCHNESPRRGESTESTFREVIAGWIMPCQVLEKRLACTDFKAAQKFANRIGSSEESPIRHAELIHSRSNCKLTSRQHDADILAPNAFFSTTFPDLVPTA